MTTISTLFCPSCGAANEITRSRCIVCDQTLTTNNDETRVNVVLRERYQILSTLGTGGFSSVFLARDLQRDSTFAIKQIKLNGLSAEEAIDATTTFNRELDLLSVLDHPQVPHLSNHFQDRDHWYLVLEYLEGPTLETYLEKRKAENRPITFDMALDMGLQLCTVLNYLHTRQPAVIFRDLKPDNIIISPGGKLSLIDFGIARRFRPGQTRDTQLLGSPGYAAPEQYGRAQTSPQSDIYSLGALLYSLLSRRDPAEHTPDLNTLALSNQTGGAAMLDLLQRMLASDPTRRPRTIGEVAETLTAIKQNVQKTQAATRIWIPPTPQPYPASASVQQQIQIQLPGQAGKATPVALRKRFLTRRKVLIGMGILVAATGGYSWWQNTSHYPYTYRGHNASVEGVAWSLDSQNIASIARDGTVYAWTASNGSAIAHIPEIVQGSGISWSPSEQTIASSYIANEIMIWNSNGNAPIVFAGHTAPVNATAWSPDGSFVASASVDKTVRVWSIYPEAVAFVYQSHTAAVNAVAWSFDGSLIASASDDGTVRIWDSTSGSNTVTYSGHTGPVKAVLWSPDGQHIISGGADKTVQIWLANDGAYVSGYYMHKAAVNALSCSSDMSLIASASDDKTVQIWDIINTVQLSAYTGHTAPVLTVAWSPYGSLIASGSADKTVQVWQPTNIPTP